MSMEYAAGNVAACADSNNNQILRIMDSFGKIEAMLAELVEQVNGQKEQSGKVLKKLDGIDERLTRLESKEPPTYDSVSMITLKDHEAKINEAVAVQT